VSQELKREEEVIEQVRARSTFENKTTTAAPAGERLLLWLVNGCFDYNYHIYSVSLLFSIPQRKFVKPLRRGGFKLLYRVPPGVYLFVHSRGLWGDEVHVFTIALAEVLPSARDPIQGEIKVLKKCKVYAEAGCWADNSLLRSIIWSVPSYRRYPYVNFRKTYDEKDVAEVLELVNEERVVRLP